ncbi:hypothetical protein [Paraburkholderia susongensis]|uniref:hypothetical protein n=1 Tax=Paraburkholderia susongensis TaxID=1515439 RepID=UPI00142DAE07|nr:hypothetical protein [Paraburkholderia susongensis]
MLDRSGRQRIEHVPEQTPMNHERPDEQEFSVLAVHDATQLRSPWLRDLGPAQPADGERLKVKAVGLVPQFVPFGLQRLEDGRIGHNGDFSGSSAHAFSWL